MWSRLLNLLWEEDWPSVISSKFDFLVESAICLCLSENIWFTKFLMNHSLKRNNFLGFLDIANFCVFIVLKSLAKCPHKYRCDIGFGISIYNKDLLLEYDWRMGSIFFGVSTKCRHFFFFVKDQPTSKIYRFLNMYFYLHWIINLCMNVIELLKGNKFDIGFSENMDFKFLGEISKLKCSTIINFKWKYIV